MSKVAERVRRECSKLREAGLRLPILALQEAADYRSLRAEIRGPSGSPFEGHSFGLQLHFGDEYPFRPPAIRFASPRRLFHPNVNGEGGICLDILNDPTLWSPAIGLEKLLVSVASLLSEPRVEHGLNDEALALLRSDPEAFEERARARARVGLATESEPTFPAVPTPLGVPGPLRTPATTAGADSERAEPAPLKDGSGVCSLLLAGLVLGLAYAIRWQSL
eukprot:s1588_g6.t1